ERIAQPAKVGLQGPIGCAAGEIRVLCFCSVGQVQRKQVVVGKIISGYRLILIILRFAGSTSHQIQSMSVSDRLVIIQVGGIVPINISGVSKQSAVGNIYNIKVGAVPIMLGK